MKSLVTVACIVLCCGSLAAFGQESPALTQPEPPKLIDPLGDLYAGATSTLADQTDVAVTVYNNDRALVRDTRTISLPSGEQTLKFMGVAEQIQPQTVGMKSLTSPGAFHILEQNYEFDLISPEKLLEKYVGKEVWLRNFDKDILVEEVKAELMSINGGPVYRVDGRIYLGYPGEVVLPEIPENLIAKPTLVWLVQSEGGDQELEVSYLTGGISWSADYVLTLARDEKSLDLAGWVTLNNQSGAAFNNATLKLVAGDVNIVQPPVQFKGRRMEAMAMAAPEPMQEEAFAEYHLYTLPRRTTIKQNQSKQVSLLSASSVAIDKIYEYRGNVSIYSSRIPPQTHENVGVFLKFENSETNNMGMPLPAGVMRVYQEDSSGMLQFSGEDRIQHTPKDEEVRLRLGNAFDVVAERIQTEYEVLGDNSFISAYKITLRNHKDVDVMVDIVEPMPNDWKILQSSHEFIKKDAQTAIFSVPVAKDGETVVTYQVRVKY